MKPRTRRTGTLLVLAVLLAAISTGGLTICDAYIWGEPLLGDTIVVNLQQGETEPDIARSDGIFYRWVLCGTLPEGTYLREKRDLRGDGLVSIDLVTTLNTPPGHYQIPYVESDVYFLGSVLYAGTIDLTVTAAPVTLTACLYCFSQAEILVVNQPITCYGCCSESTQDDPIVQYKWWFNYNGNPNSPPDATTTVCETEHTYTTVGQKSVRLVVRTQSGQEAATGQTITVVSGL